MSKVQSLTFDQQLRALEASIVTLEAGAASQPQLELASGHLTDAVRSICAIPIDEKLKSLSAVLERAAIASSGRRESAILVLRALSVRGVLPFERDFQLERRVVELVEAGFQDQLRALKLGEKRQTFEKLTVLMGFHESTCQQLHILAEVRPTLADIDSAKPDIQRATKNGALSAYLTPFGWTSIKGRINQLCEQATELHGCKDASYKQRFEQMEFTCTELRSECGLIPSFLSQQYVIPFIESVEEAMNILKAGSAEKFSCSLEPRRKQPDVAAKRYPLHLINKWLTITVPFVNKGPGVAVDVTVELDCGNQGGLALENEEIRLGDIPPGEFAISFRAVVVVSMVSVELAMQVTWRELFGESKSTALDVRITGQDSNVDWASLELLEPYSLEVADEDRFVGRRSKVQAIGNRLLRAQMSSTYITGQKRIGKTSLAQAVLRYLVDNAKPPLEYVPLYLEWGEYCDADASRTVQALGDSLHSFLCSLLPDGTVAPQASYEGSLAPLNAVARLLEQKCPNKRIVIVLDEFDEIHPEMYRYGPLAEAFFANLRTLSAKKNLAFVLVGGEKMPFIIGAQGDQLNKFVREPLDYFSRSDEWTDYVELITDPVRNYLNWEDSALTELYSLTAGHPYYTKLLCAKVFSTAVAERDTEIIVSDVKHGLIGCVSELDTNAFAHFWKDGISGERDEAEVVELKRLRVLVAFGRAARSGRACRESISQQLTGGTLHASEVGPVIDDFCRRDVMREVNSEVAISLPLFQLWVRDVGITKLIASTLADELESQLQKANDDAYVMSAEITSLVAEWPLYRGKEVSAVTVRAWLEQVPNAQEQRLLFKLLRHLRFVTSLQISEALSQAHDRVVVKVTPPVKRDNKVEKRRDLLVTYLDGPGKSGAYYARAYAKEIGLLLECVLEPSKLARRLVSDAEQPTALVIVDDLAGTGRTVAGGIDALIAPIADRLESTNTPVVLVLLFATEEAETKIRQAFSKYPKLTWRVHVCESLGDESRAFVSGDIGFWKDEDERDRAKALCIRLGAGLYSDPLGFGSQSLLLAFPDGCPNNNLPIIFAARAGAQPWTALLPRPAS